jgi:hypothetical protein
MKFADGICSDIMLYIPSFIKIGPGIEKLRGKGQIDNKYTGWRSHKSTFIF